MLCCIICETVLIEKVPTYLKVGWVLYSPHVRQVNFIQSESRDLKFATFLSWAWMRRILCGKIVQSFLKDKNIDHNFFPL